MLGNYNGKIAGGEEKDLVTQNAGDFGEWNWPAMTIQFRKCCFLCNTVGIPFHRTYTPHPPAVDRLVYF